MLKILLGTEGLLSLVQRGRASLVYEYLRGIEYPVEHVFVSAQSVAAIDQACRDPRPTQLFGNRDAGELGPVALHNLDQLTRRCRQHRRLLQVDDQIASKALALSARLWPGLNKEDVYSADWWVFATAQSGSLGANVRLIYKRGGVGEALGFEVVDPMAAERTRAADHV